MIGNDRCTSDNLELFSRVLNVSTDYLLGLTDTMFVEPNMKTAATCTGLSDAALLCLNKYTDADKAALSSMITSDKFLYLIRSISAQADETVDKKKADICEKVFSKIEKRSDLKREEFYRETEYGFEKGKLFDISHSATDLPNFQYLDPQSAFFENLEENQNSHPDYRSEAYRYFSEFVQKGFDLGLIAKQVSDNLASERIGDETHFYAQIEKRVVELIRSHLFLLEKQVVEDYSGEGELIVSLEESTEDNTKVIDKIKCTLDEFFGENKNQ